MNKTDKILYGGFAVVAIGVVVAMLVSVLLPPKKVAKEETVEPQTPQTDSAEAEITPPEGYVAYYLDENGNKVWLTREEVDAEFAAVEEAEEEYKRQEAERIAKEKAKEQAEKEWWASRQDWIDRFPFEPTHHPEITYDPTAYDPRKVGEWPEAEKDDAYWEMQELVENHGFLRNFYESKLPYTEEFEQMHDIIHEELGEMANDTILLVDNTILLGWTFDHLKSYHHAMTKDPEEIRWKNVQRTIRPPMPELLPSMLEGLTPEQFAVYRALPGEARREMTKELRHGRDQEMIRRIQNYHNSFKTVTVDVTWSEEAQSLKDGMLAELLNRDGYGEPWIPMDQARALVDRLVNEIPADGFLEMEGNLHYVHRYELELEQGDPLLIK